MMISFSKMKRDSVKNRKRSDCVRSRSDYVRSSRERRGSCFKDKKRR